MAKPRPSARLTADYEAEQGDLETKAKDLQAKVDKGEEATINVDKFIALVRKYTEIQELTPTILNEFIGKIEIHAPDKSSGQRVQEIDIYYNFVGGIPCTLTPRRSPMEKNIERWGNMSLDMRSTLQNPYTAA